MAEKAKTKKGGSFEELLNNYFANVPDVGDNVKGKIISIENGSVRIDVNGVTTGIVRGKELFSESEVYSNLKVGEEIEASVVELENETGEVELSFRVAGYENVWNKMRDLVESGLTVPAKILQANKGGLMVQVDALVSFLPVSQLSPENYPRVPGGDKDRILEHLKALIGKTLQVKIIDVDQRDEKLIVSEKAVWEDDQKAVLESYKVGNIVDGEVSALTSFGAFIKFGEGLEGLVHISEIVWQRIEHPRDVLKVGQKVQAQIIDLNKSKIYLSVKRLVEDPWKSVKDRYQVDQVVKGEVHKVEPFGLMVKLDNEIHGLAHISELSDKTIHDSRELEVMFEVGKEYDFEIVNIEPAEHRLGLRVAGLKKKKKEVKPAKKKVEEVKKEVVVEEVTAEKLKAKEVVETSVVKKKKVKKEKVEEKPTEVVEESKVEETPTEEVKEESVEEKVETPTEEKKA
ncbi:MAG: S1 RNA-binding domain-containing protein [Candidatus Magasanikbacteria bacterium]|nr:S1 RNA-binding domain-containing protein [Candidatus Magasanikbacteria bacterium]